jgi:hypothetical protein
VTGATGLSRNGTGRERKRRYSLLDKGRQVLRPRLIVDYCLIKHTTYNMLIAPEAMA